jgi:hypothetical protein
MPTDKFAADGEAKTRGQWVTFHRQSHHPRAEVQASPDAGDPTGRKATPWLSIQFGCRTIWTLEQYVSCPQRLRAIPLILILGCRAVSFPRIDFDRDQ